MHIPPLCSCVILPRTGTRDDKEPQQWDKIFFFPLIPCPSPILQEALPLILIQMRLRVNEPKRNCRKGERRENPLASY